MDELALLVKGVLADLAGAGALADALAERGREREARLLRLRAARWDKEWRAAPAEALKDAKFRADDAGVENRMTIHRRRAADYKFKKYIQGRFLRKRNIVAQVTPHECQVGRSCTCSMTALEPAEDCPVHSGGGWPRCERCGRMMKWSAR